MKIITTLMLFASLSFANALVLNDTDTVSLRDAFSNSSVAKVINQLQTVSSNLPEHSEVNLYINSPGGSIIAGNELIKFVNSLGRKVNVICDFCASMGFQTFQGIRGTRYITQFGVLMSHKASGGFSGEFPGQVNNRLDFWLRRLEKMDKIVVAKTKGKHTLQSYQALYENEYWCTDTDCIEQGFADKVVDVKCGKSMNGTQSEVINTFFGNYEIHMSKCPLVSGIIKYRKLDREGDPVGPFMSPTNKMSNLKKMWMNSNIRQINYINLNK